MVTGVVDDAAQTELRLDSDERFWEGARRMLAALEAKVAAHGEQVDERGTLVERGQDVPPAVVAA